MKLVHCHSIAAMALLALGRIAAGHAQAQLITVGPNVRVSVDRSTLSHAEAMITADPTDPNALAACVMVNPKPGEPVAGSNRGGHTVLYVSHDGGRQWTAAVHDSASGPEGRITGVSSWDPSCAFGPGGWLYFTSGTRIAPDWTAHAARIRTQRSPDRGRTWLPATVVDGGYFDKPFIVVDPSPNSPYSGRVYVMYFADGDKEKSDGIPAVVVSKDNAATFAGRVLPDTGRSVGGFPYGGTVLADGTVAFIDAELRAVLSANGGESFEIRRVGEVRREYRANQEHISAFLSGMASDRGSGPFQGRAYAVWDAPEQGRSQIHVSYSADRGRTWSRPSIVNDDRPHDPSGATGPDNKQPAIAVSAAGVVGVMWHEITENADLSMPGYSVRFSASLDGGDTWLPSVRVSEQRHVPIDIRTAAKIPFSGGESTFYILDAGDWNGHYAGITANAAGTFFPVWIDNRTGVSQLWTAPINVRGPAVRHGDPALASYMDVSDYVRARWHDITTRRIGENDVEITAKLTLVNTSTSRTVRAPVVLRFLSITANAAGVTVLGARNGVAGAGAVFDLGPALRGEALGPGELSAPMTIRFRLDDLAFRSSTRYFDRYPDLSVRHQVRVLSGGGESTGSR